MATTTPRFRLRRRSAANWTATNEVLLNGEPGLVIDEAGRTTALKVGDGVTAWEDLPYLIAAPGDGSGIITEHSQLNGLGNDDHPQYLTPERAGALFALLDHGHAAYMLQVARGAAGGVAPLGSDGLVPALFLPPVSTAIVEVDSLAALPVTGQAGTLYVTQDNSRLYHWIGEPPAYHEVSAEPPNSDAVEEGESNLYHTAARVRAATLEGLSLASGAAVAAGDSVLAALGKLQRQINDLIAGGGVGSGEPTGAISLSGAGSILLDGNYLVLA